MTQEGNPYILLPLNRQKGWNEDLKNQFEELISNLNPDEIIDELKKLNEEHPSFKKSTGRPKSYQAAWIQLESNLIDYSQFHSLVLNQLKNGEITHYTYNRALKRAKDFLNHRERIILNNTRTYQEAWIEFYTERINWEEFQQILQKLLQEEKISEEKYEEALRLGVQFRKLRQHIGKIKLQ